MKKPQTVEAYIQDFPAETQSKLRQIREAIKMLVPDAEETISYGIPTYKKNGKYLIYFSGNKNHIGVYPVPVKHEDLKDKLSEYKTSGKGTVQFPLNKELPMPLIKKIIKVMEKQHAERTKLKSEKSKA